MKGVTGLFFVLSGLLFLPLRGADYQMEVVLNPESKIISGTEVIRWTNKASFPANDLQFHLYYNAWRDRQSSFLNSKRVVSKDFDDWRENEWSYNEINSLVLLSEEGIEIADLTSQIEYIQPDDNNSYDRTVMRVMLPQPIEPGGTIVISIEFISKVPRTFARTGFRDDYFFIAHWFPKLGVFEKEGNWNCHQFIQTEFFSNFGTYDVKLTVPEDWLVGATGIQKDYQKNSNGTATHHYYQEQVHDFTWTTSPYFLEYKKRFEHSFLKPVDVRLLLMPDHKGQQDRYFASTLAALKYYGEWFGEYPYGHLTVIDPAYRSRSGGMEYPTLFTGGTRWLNPLGSNNPEEVTVHEAGHQFWYGMVANNEFEDAWLDEGFNTYSTERVMLEVFGPNPLVKRYLDGFIPILFKGMYESGRTVSGLGNFYSNLKLDTMSTPSWRYGPAASRGGKHAAGRDRIYGPGAYVLNSYTKPALMFFTLERYLGWETFQKILSTYFEQWKFNHPLPQDFFDITNQISGEDLSWFWEQTYFSSNVFDYAVDSVYSTDDSQEVIIRRWGEGVFPVEIVITFDDGRIVEEKWQGTERWVSYGYQGSAQISTVQVDPKRVLALDVNLTNNSWTSDPSSSFAARKWSFKWLIWLQNLMELFVFFS